MRSFGRHAHGGPGPCYLEFDGSGADPVVWIGEEERRLVRRRRRIAVAALGSCAGLGLLCAALSAWPAPSTHFSREQSLEEVPFAAATRWQPYQWGHKWKPYKPDHNVFDYMYKDPNTAGKNPAADIDAPGAMADDGVREWGENEFYRFKGDITKGPKRQAIAIIDGLGLKGEHHFLGTGGNGGGGGAGGGALGALPMPGSAQFAEEAGKELGVNGAAIASAADLGAGGGGVGAGGGAGESDGGNGGGEGGEGGGGGGGGANDGGGGEEGSGARDLGGGGGGESGKPPSMGSDCYLLPELCPQKSNWHPYRPEFAPGTPEAVEFARKQAAKQAVAPAPPGATKEEAEEAKREAAPKLSFDVDTSVDNGAQGKGESISIDTAVDSDFVGGPKRPTMAAMAPVSTLLSVGEEQSLEADWQQAEEDPARQREIDDELTRVAKHYDLSVGTTNFGSGVTLNDEVMPGQKEAGDADQVWGRGGH